MRLYRALLKLYPERFREEYGEQLCRAFADRTHGRSRMYVIAAAIGDVVPNAVAAHWDILRYGAGAGLTVPAFSGDVRFAIRQIRRTPLLSGVIIAVIALGIGINAGMLTVLNTYAWRPAIGIPRDASLARLRPTAALGKDGASAGIRLSYRDVLDLRERHDVFDDVAAWTSTVLPVDLSGGAESIDVSYTTANYFRMLRVGLAAGSGFPDDADRSGAHVAIIGHSLWMTRFGGAPDVVGKQVRVMNVPFTIVGVAPAMFVGVDVMKLGEPMVWLPFGAREPGANPGALTRRDATTLRTVARLEYFDFTTQKDR